MWHTNHTHTQTRTYTHTHNTADEHNDPRSRIIPQPVAACHPGGNLMQYQCPSQCQPGFEPVDPSPGLATAGCPTDWFWEPLGLRCRPKCELHQHPMVLAG